MQTSAPAKPPLDPLLISDPIELDVACEHQQVTWAILTVNELPLEYTRWSPLVTLIDCGILAVLHDDDIIELSSVVQRLGLCLYACDVQN